jgi:PAS domain S-box-containing protein
VNGAPVHILLLDDAPEVAPVLASVLGIPGQQLVHARTPGEALAQVRAADFALILVRVAAGTQAFDATRMIHDNRRSSHTPVIVLAPHSVADFPFEQAYAAGAVDVLPSPPMAAVLRAKAAFFIDAYRNAAERRQAEAALRDTRAHLDSTLAAAELATWTWDLRADRITADATMARMFNISPADASGAPVAVYLKALHPDDVPGAMELISNALASGQPYDASYRVRGADGAWRSVIARGHITLGDDGKPARLRGIVIDVTRQRQAEDELRASEERYRTLFESVDEGVCVVEMLYDANGRPCDYRFLETNPAFVQHTGLANAIGKTCSELIPGHEQHWFDTYGRVAATGEPVRFVNEAKALHRWYDVYAVRVGDAAQARVAILFTDISERVRTESELRRLAADLSEADRRKTQFLATLAHELRNPLAPLRSGLQVMRLAGSDQATIARVQDIMDRQLSHMVELVDDLLDVARIAHGQVELRRAAIDLKEVVRNAIETSMPLIEAARHRLEIALPDRALPLVGDQTRLTQVVSNVLNNAAKYTPRGGAIGLSARVDGGQACIAVSDNGVGIPAESLHAVFEMFTQVGRNKDRAQGGLGIGLSLVRSLVQLHGGTVEAASAGPGLGSTFTIRLPLAPGALPAAAAPAFPPEGNGTLRILVVDDNRDAAETLAALLGLLGHSVKVANDGQQALQVAPEFDPDLVFLDLGMPRLSGYDVARALRSDLRLERAVLVALTGWGGDNDRARTSAAGFDLHLTKPVTMATIGDLLADPARYKELH